MSNSAKRFIAHSLSRKLASLWEMQDAINNTSQEIVIKHAASISKMRSNLITAHEKLVAESADTSISYWDLVRDRANALIAERKLQGKRLQIARDAARSQREMLRSAAF